MSVHEGHRARLRARFLKNGLGDFDEHNALELLLFYARPRCDTNEIAHRLIKKFGSFSAALDAPFEEIANIEGLGDVSATLLKMIPEMCSFYLNSKIEPGIIIDSTQKAGEFFMPKFFGKPNEEFHLLCLDDKKKIVRSVCLSKAGITNAVAISVKKLVTEVVSTNATGVIVAHNHPGGLALPSLNDKKVTAQIIKALYLINVQFLDHLIFADDDFISMADSGFVKEMQRKLNFS